MPLFHRVAVPSQDLVRPYLQAETLQHLPERRCEEYGGQGPLLGREPHFLRAELPFHDGDLVAQVQDLGVLGTVTCREQPQCGEGIRHSQAGEAQEHG
ncbi:hypothetical protein [Streptomyces sp. NPDC048527]|uniref:hypothetical protein n=1 Tax=Streptomyces sp. NPDC048527 TaxID=3365568 RepID=UPI003722EC5A